MSAASRPRRNTAVDVTKTVAILGTVMIHTAAAGGFNDPVGSLNWTSALFWGCLLRCAVPLFLMCSGALFLAPEKDLPLGRLWGKYIRRIVIALAAWSLIYVLWDGFLNLRGGLLTGAALRTALLDWVCFRHKYHLYYLVVMVAVYAFLPVFRLLLQKADRRLLCYMAGLWLATGCLLPFLFTQPPLSFVEGFPREYAVSFTWFAMGLGPLGRVISSSRRKLSPAFYGIVYLAGFVITFAGTLLLSLKQGWLCQHLLQGSAPGVVLQAVGIYGACDALCRGRRPVRWAERVSRASFCIYLIHPVFLDLLILLGFHAGARMPLWVVPAGVAILFCAGFASWLVLRRIPVVNEYLI